MTRLYDLLIFDLDGVITTERIYWDCARLTLWQYMRDLRLRPAEHVSPGDMAAVRALLPDEVLFVIKDRAINSNWDLTFLALCAVFAALRVDTGAQSTTSALLARLQAETQVHEIPWPQLMLDLLQQHAGTSGAALIAAVGAATARTLNTSEALFVHHGPLWQHSYERFQRWYNGEAAREHGIPPLEEQPAIPLDQIQAPLSQLHAVGYQLGVATGRPRDEALNPLQALGVLKWFVPERIATYSDVLLAQQESGAASLGKPHPYTLHKALFPTESVQSLLDAPPQPQRALLIGDAVSDALAATAAGINCVGVLSGVHTAPARAKRQDALQRAGCCAVLEDVSALPDWLNARSG